MSLGRDTSRQLVGVKGAVGGDGTWLPVERLDAGAGAPARVVLDPSLDRWVYEEHGRRSTREVRAVQETCAGMLARCCRSMAWAEGSVAGVRMVREACAWGNGMGVEYMQELGPAWCGQKKVVIGPCVLG